MSWICEMKCSGVPSGRRTSETESRIQIIVPSRRR